MVLPPFLEASLFLKGIGLTSISWGLTFHLWAGGEDGKMWLGGFWIREVGEGGGGQNPILFTSLWGSSRPCPWRDHCCAEVTGHTGQFWYKPALENNNNDDNNNSTCIELSLIPANLVSPNPSFGMARTTGLCNCWQAWVLLVTSGDLQRLPPGSTPNLGESGQVANTVKLLTPS